MPDRIYVYRCKECEVGIILSKKHELSLLCICGGSAKIVSCFSVENNELRELSSREMEDEEYRAGGDGSE